uniref:Reverse transcriptase domain-containing protein n=1 Tax=Nitella hyalina TaxID=181804 RepID=H9LR21_NITHY|nr:hypothetical protein NIHY_p06 [Nitella hyalina]AEH42856.1 hypothetical protein NhyaMp08 [Nitella hyalina]
MWVMTDCVSRSAQSALIRGCLPRRTMWIYPLGLCGNRCSATGKNQIYVTTGCKQLRLQHGGPIVAGEGNQPCKAAKRVSQIPQTNKSLPPDKIRGGLSSSLRERKLSGRYTDLIGLLADPKFLIYCYETIKSKPGNMTPGKARSALDGLTKEWFTHLATLLQQGRFAPDKATDIVRGRFILKIVQKAMQVILEMIYEEKFIDCSHAFQPGRGSEGAALTLASLHVGIKKHQTWAIEGDITNCFDSIDHNLIMQILKKEIACDKFLALVKGSLKAGYKTNVGKVHIPRVVTPQALTSLCFAPLLWNLVLHELDQFVSSTLKAKFDTETPRRRLSEAIVRASALQIATKTGNRRTLWKTSSADPMDPGFKRLFYVRYADDFVIIITGSRADAVDIKRLVTQFLSEELKLELNQVRSTKISHMSKHGISLLSTQIHAVKWKAQNQVSWVRREAHGKVYRRRIHPRLILRAPIKELVERLKKYGFVRRTYKGDILPMPIRIMIPMDHADILAFYNAKTRGILNYYSFAAPLAGLSRIIHLLWSSCGLTLSTKYKLRSLRKTVYRLGKDLKCPETGTTFYKPSNYHRHFVPPLNRTRPCRMRFSKLNGRAQR